MSSYRPHFYHAKKMCILLIDQSATTFKTLIVFITDHLIATQCCELKSWI